jgi:protocatechuate 3,4-dioxygenase alpha subunit
VIEKKLPGATPSQTVGPFFHFGLTPIPNGRMIDRLQEGDQISLIISVTDGDGAPVDDAMVELLQDGVFGRLPTGEGGTCEFQTVLPESHISVCLFARGLLRQLHTRIYFPTNPAIDNDPVLALVPKNRRGTLLATPDERRPAAWRFDVRLQGARETVFFDL